MDDCGDGNRGGYRVRSRAAVMTMMRIQEGRYCYENGSRSTCGLSSDVKLKSRGRRRIS